MFKQLHINITLADALILMSKCQKMLKALLSNKKKLQELANTPLNENCSVVILKKLPKKLGDPRKFLIPCGFSELKSKTLADLVSGSLPSNIVANPKGELKAITTRSGLVLDGPTVPSPPLFINSDVDECVEETLTDPDLSEYTIKVPHSPV
uniref:Reverse transcriptase domain-containing protein n=1 Tax=Tanacetum cinerariifolium TaxID=118510 RepID=A0A699TKP0_TANCI|nr:reverse transcriptase domain-containing protein [Tanacetum cinerariifolium]